MITVDKLQETILQEINREIEFIRRVEPVNLYEPIAYALAVGGKRLRPVMVLMSYNLFKDDISRVYPTALAIEIFHNFTLLHDDIMDCADVRRNQPTVHKKYTPNTAILSGDAMSILSYNYLLKTETRDIKSLVSLFSQTAIEVCEGQQYDMDFETRLDVRVEEYLKMIKLKTAVLIACSLKAGALVAEADEKSSNQLYELGIALGMAFQLQDDLLDVFADEDKFGKKIGGDIVANKKTYLLIKALELSQGETRKNLIEWISKKDFDPAEKVRQVSNIYNQLGIQLITLKKIDEYNQIINNLIGQIQISEEKRSQLLAFCHSVLRRDH